MKVCTSTSRRNCDHLVNTGISKSCFLFSTTACLGALGASTQIRVGAASSAVRVPSGRVRCGFGARPRSRWLVRVPVLFREVKARAPQLSGWKVPVTARSGAGSGSFRCGFRLGFGFWKFPVCTGACFGFKQAWWNFGQTDRASLVEGFIFFHGSFW